MVFSRVPWIPLICGERHAKIVHPVSRKYSLKKPSRFVVQRPGKHEPIQPGIRMFSWSDRSHSRKTYEFRPGKHTKNPEFLRIPGFSIRLETALSTRRLKRRDSRNGRVEVEERIRVSHAHERRAFLHARILGMRMRTWEMPRAIYRDVSRVKGARRTKNSRRASNLCMSRHSITSSS